MLRCGPVSLFYVVQSVSLCLKIRIYRGTSRLVASHESTLRFWKFPCCENWILQLQLRACWGFTRRRPYENIIPVLKSISDIFFSVSLSFFGFLWHLVLPVVNIGGQEIDIRVQNWKCWLRKCRYLGAFLIRCIRYHLTFPKTRAVVKIEKCIFFFLPDAESAFKGQACRSHVIPTGYSDGQFGANFVEAVSHAHHQRQVAILWSNVN